MDKVSVAMQDLTPNSWSVEEPSYFMRIKRMSLSAKFLTSEYVIQFLWQTKIGFLMAKKKKNLSRLSAPLDAPGSKYKPVLIVNRLDVGTLKKLLRSKAVMLGPDHPSLRLLRKQIVDMEMGIVKR